MNRSSDSLILSSAEVKCSDHFVYIFDYVGYIVEFYVGYWKNI